MAEDYTLNLIDTPGHVDFTYEVSRSLAACEGALLVVDATQGIEAQTIANLYLALEHDLTIIPVVNKIDLPSAEPERVLRELEEVDRPRPGHGHPGQRQDRPRHHGDPGGDRRAHPRRRGGEPEDPPRALIFDSHYDPYRGVIAYVRVVEGELRPGLRIRFMASGPRL